MFGHWIWDLAELVNRDTLKADLAVCLEPISALLKFIMQCPISISSPAAENQRMLNSPF